MASYLGQILRISFLLLGISLSGILLGQDQPSNSPIKVKNADNFIYQRIDNSDHQYFRGDVRMYHDSIYMFADSTFIIDELMTSIGEVVILQEDTISIFSDSLSYNSDSKQAKLFYNVVLDMGGKQLFTQRLDYNLDEKKAVFADTAILKKGALSLSSIRGVYDLDKRQVIFSDQVVVINDDFRLTTDELEYDTEIDRAYFISPTYITQGDRNIYCEEGYYDIEGGEAYFTKNARVVERDREVTAGDMIYNEADSTIVFEGDVEIIDSDGMTRGDRVVIHEDSEDVEVIGNASYEHDGKLITGPQITYNKGSERVTTAGRTTVVSESGTLDANNISYDKRADLGHATGQVFWQDTSGNQQLKAEFLDYRETDTYFKAYGESLKPLYLQQIENDTLYLSADTLFTYATGDSLNHLKATNEVLIYKSDLQARADSLYYSDVDSTFILYGSPICWSDSTMITGDTLKLIMVNDEIREIIAINNAFLISRKPGDYYDQIKGKKIHSYMADQELREMEVKGSAESLYMIQDKEDAYVGSNITLCSHMTFYFQDKELKHIKFYTEPESRMTPMGLAQPDELKLEGFNWDESLRPNDKADLRIKRQSRRTEEMPPAGLDEFESSVLQTIDGAAPIESKNEPLHPKSVKKN